MLMMDQAMEQILISRDTVIFLMEHLGFGLNLERSIFNPVQEIEFLSSLSPASRWNRVVGG